MNPWWLRPPADSDEDPTSADPASATDGDGPRAGDEAPIDDRSPETGSEATSRWSSSEAPRRRRRSPRRRSRRSPVEIPEDELVTDPPPEVPRAAPRATPPPGDLEARVEVVGRNAVQPALERNRTVDHSHSDERKIGLFCDLENIALGVRDDPKVAEFDIRLVLERLLEKGKIIVKRAYADWERYREYKRTFHEAGIELIDIPKKRYSGKNSADIKMVVDAMDLCFSKEHLDTFVIMSGDSDFSPLVSKLKENNKDVIGIGVRNSSSSLLVDSCDEFIYYEDVWRDLRDAPKLSDSLPQKTTEAFSLMTDAIKALKRENKDVLWGSMVKQTMQRKRPSFNEGYYGYSNFTELLVDAQKNNLIALEKDQRSGTYIVTELTEGR